MNGTAILDSPYIYPCQAARLLNLTVPEVYLLQAQGKLTDVVATPGNHRRYSQREVLNLLSEIQRNAAHG